MEEYIKSLIIGGYTDKTIILYCKKKDFHPTESVITLIRNNVRLESQIEQLNKDLKSKNGVKGKHITPLFSETETYFDFAKRIGVETEYSSVEELIRTVQNLTSMIFIKQAICLLRGLEILSAGDDVKLDFLYKGYEIAFKAIEKAYGLQTLIDLNAAIYTLNSKGFTIDASNTDIPKISE